LHFLIFYFTTGFHLGLKELEHGFQQPDNYEMTAITRAKWTSKPRLKTKNPSSYKIKRIIPIINKIPMLPPLFI
jgi:hypothetical protein